MTEKNTTSLATLTWSGVTAQRMARQALIAPATDLGPADAASAMCGAHAQVLSAAELLARPSDRGGDSLRRATRAVGAPHAGQDVRPRGTVHLLAAPRAADVDRGAVRPAVSGAQPEPVRFTLDQVEEVLDAIGTVLSGAELTADELTEAIVAATGPWAGEPVRCCRPFRGCGPAGASSPARRTPRRAVLRPRQGPQRDLYQPAPLATGLPARHRRPRPARPHGEVPVRLRSGAAKALREVAQHSASPSNRTIRRPIRRPGKRRDGR